MYWCGMTIEQGELDVAERYLTRAAALSSGTTRGLEGSGQRASDWVALMKFMSEKRPPSTRAADAMVRPLVSRS